MYKRLRLFIPSVWHGPLMVLAGGACIGLAPIGLRLGLGDLGPQAIAFWRYFFALPVLFVLVVVRHGHQLAPPSFAIVIAGICFALDIALWHWSLTLTSVSNATFIVNLGNVCAGLTAWFVLREKLTPVWGVAVMIALAGAGGLSFGGRDGGPGDIHGDILAFAAAIMVSGYMLASKVARRKLGGLEAIFWLNVVELAVAALVVNLSGERWLPTSLSGLVMPLCLALFVQVMGQGLIIGGLGRTSTGIAGILILVQPVVAATIAWWLFDETLTLIQAGGALLILIAIVVSQTGCQKSSG